MMKKITLFGIFISILSLPVYLYSAEDALRDLQQSLKLFVERFPKGTVKIQATSAREAIPSDGPNKPLLKIYRELITAVLTFKGKHSAVLDVASAMIDVDDVISLSPEYKAYYAILKAVHFDSQISAQEFRQLMNIVSNKYKNKGYVNDANLLDEFRPVVNNLRKAAKTIVLQDILLLKTIAAQEDYLKHLSQAPSKESLMQSIFYFQTTDYSLESGDTNYPKVYDFQAGNAKDFKDFGHTEKVRLALCALRDSVNPTWDRLEQQRKIALSKPGLTSDQRDSIAKTVKWLKVHYDFGNNDKQYVWDNGTVLDKYRDFDKARDDALKRVEPSLDERLKTEFLKTLPDFKKTEVELAEGDAELLEELHLATGQLALLVNKTPLS